MEEWVVTAKTIYCEEAEEYVTLLIYWDGSVRCTGQKALPSVDRKRKSEGCRTPNCGRLEEYKRVLFRKG